MDKEPFEKNPNENEISQDEKIENEQGENTESAQTKTEENETDASVAQADASAVQTDDSTAKAATTATAAGAAVQAYSWKREVFEWVEAIVIAVVLAILIRTFVFSLVKVEGDSMKPTLHNNDRLIVWRLGYVPKKDDIIILRPVNYPTTPFVKRVIALPGQEVNIDFKQHKVYVDGKEQNEPFIYQATSETGNVKFPVTVPDKCVFVMGDNRNNSKDSRFQDVGMIPYNTIMGKAVFRLWPFNSIGSVYTNSK